MEAVNPKSGKRFFRHPKTDATAWVLPKGSVLDPVLSLRTIRERIRTMHAVA
jgi:hypothetical protein